MIPYLSIILPAYNEERRLPACLDRLTARLWNYTHYKSEIIIVENGSTDRTMDIAYRWCLDWDMVRKPIHIDQASKAAAVRTGMLAAKGEYILMADVDLSTPPEEFPRFLDLARLGPYDVVIGSRALPGSKVTQSPRRAFIGKIFRLLTGLVLPGIPDTQCGFKLFTHAAAMDLFANLKTRSMAFDVEILLSARRRGYSIAQLPVTWTENADSRVHLVRDSISMARDVYRLWRGVNWDGKMHTKSHQRRPQLV
jgi:dolichyl-phosphate beta-glucosyltransferase